MIFPDEVPLFVVYFLKIQIDLLVDLWYFCSDKKVCAKKVVLQSLLPSSKILWCFKFVGQFLFVCWISLK